MLTHLKISMNFLFNISIWHNANLITNVILSLALLFGHMIEDGSC